MKKHEKTTSQHRAPGYRGTNPITLMQRVHMFFVTLWKQDWAMNNARSEVCV